MYPVPDETHKPTSVFLVGKRPPLDNYPMLWRWLARLVYHQINWAPDYGIEYQGVFETEAAARHAASAPGTFYIELPLNCELPTETSSYGSHDFPHSSASCEYRNRRFSFVAVPTELVSEALVVSQQLGECTQGSCTEVQ